MKVTRLLVVACAAGLAGCAEYMYQPAEHATAQIRGRVAADYPLPPKQPQGDVRVASFGMSKVTPANQPGQTERAVHLRMVVANNDSAQPWTIDTRELRVDFPGAGQMPPAYVWAHDTAERARLPIVTIPAGQQRVLDLFYPLPAGMQKASHLPEFDALWRVHVGDRVFAERTPFDRLAIVPAYAYGYGPGWGWYGDWGGPFWYDPWYPPGAVPPPFAGSGVLIGAPSWP